LLDSLLQEKDSNKLNKVNNPTPIVVVKTVTFSVSD